MKTVVFFGLCAGAIVTSVIAEEADVSRPERKGPHAEKGKGHHDRKRGKPHFGPRGDMFRMLDKNGDRNITKDEFFAGPRLERLPLDQRETIFARLDSDGDEVISREEIRKMRKNAENSAKREFRHLDKDGNGGLSFEEFSAGPLFGRLPEEKRRQIFDRMDTDGSGEITAEDKPKGPPRRKERLAD